MIHTYQDPKVLGSRALGFVLGSLVLSLPLSWLLFDAFGEFRWADMRAAAEGTGFAFLLAFFIFRRHQYGRCCEIRLSDDGACELETRRRVIRLHASEIRSVDYSFNSEGDSECYIVRYKSGKLVVTDRMAEFRDFLTRLKALNPRVDLTTFPADAWPGLRTPATEVSGINLNRLVRTAGFPLIVILGLILLTIETLSGKS